MTHDERVDEIMAVLFADWRGVRQQVQQLRLMREDWGAIVDESPWLQRRVP